MSGEGLLQERQNNVCQKNEQLNSLFFTSEEDFIAKYEQNYKDTPRAKEYTFFILDKLKKSIVKDDIGLLKNQYDQLEFVSKSDSSTVGFLNDSESPVRWTTLIIEACKYNRQEILEYLLRAPGNSSIQWSGVQDSTAQLERTDEETHNAFYYAVRSSNTHLLKTLIEEWPHQYLTSNPDKLDEVLAKAYSELKLKNVLISKQMEVFVQQKLIDLRFFSDEPAHVANPLDDERNIKERIELVLENIRLLIKDFSNSDVNERFLHILRFIGHNAHVLKGQLRLTCDRLWTDLPWGEIVFCIVCFVSSHVKQQEINLLFNVTLSKSKILEYLKHFENKLEIDKSSNRPKYTATELKALKREKVVKDIINSCNGFEKLYDDHQILMDHYSLVKLSSYTKLMIAADPEKRADRLRITRALQVIGEHLKNSLDFPKMSSTISELLLASLQKNTLSIMKDLRNELSHTKFFLKRMDIEDKDDHGIFIGIQNDAKKIDYLVASILYQQKIKTLRKLLKRISEIVNVEEANEFAKIFNNVDFSDLIANNSRMSHQEELQKLMKEFKKIITGIINEHEKEQLKEIDKVIASIDVQPQQLKTIYCLMFSSIKSICLALDCDKLDLETAKTRADRLLELSTPNMKISDAEKIVEFAVQISDSVSSRIKIEDYNKINILIFQMACSADYEIENVKWIEKLKQKLIEKNSGVLASRRRTSSETEEEWNRTLTSKLSELKKIIISNYSNDLTFGKLVFAKTDEIQAEIAMLVLDTLLILKEHKKCLDDNKYFVDDNVPLLTGKSLRDYLTHDGAFMDMSPYDPAIAIVLNACKLADMDVTAIRKLGKPVRDCPATLKIKYEQELQVICVQEQLFTALSKEEVSAVAKSVKNGADINGKSTDLRTSLHFASVSSNNGILEFVLKNGVDPKAKDILGQTPLHVAAKYGRTHNVDLLIKYGASVKDVDNHGKTPLHIAVKNGHETTVAVLLNHASQDFSDASHLYDAVKYNRIELVKNFMKSDANFNINQAISGFTLLYIAAESGNLSMVKFLLQQNASVRAENDNNGGTPLIIAAMKGHFEIVNVLLEKNPAVDHPFIDGFTPLHCAAENGREDIVNALLNYNANPKLPDRKGFTPLHYAACNGHTAIVIILLDHKADPNPKSNRVTPLHLAAECGHENIVTTLLLKHADVQKEDVDGNIPLHSAARNGHESVVRLLVEKKESTVHAKNVKDGTPLHLAAINGHEETMRFLIGKKAVVNTPDKEGFQPLHILAKYGHVNAISYLLATNKVAINVKTNAGFTPLFIAAYTGSKESVDALINKNARINRKKCRSTPLHAAAKEGHVDIVQLLLDKNAKLNVKDKNGDTALHAAAKEGHSDIVDLLIAKGANINEKNNLEWTPLISAITYNNKKIVEILCNKKADEKDGIPLSIAVISGFKDIVDVLLRNKAAIKKPISNKFTSSHIAAMNAYHDIANSLTPLHLAALRGNEKIVKYLISRGADVNAKVGSNATPLHFASAEGSADVVELLITSNADVRVTSKKGTPLHVAAQFGHYAVVKILLNHPLVEVDAKSKENFSAINLAAMFGHLRIVKRITEWKEMDPAFCLADLRGTKGETMLHFASMRNNVEIVRYLLSKGCYIDAIDHFGSRPIHFAVQAGHLELVDFLIAQGAQVNRKVDDVSMASPLYFAAKSGHRKIVESLLRNGAFLTDLPEKPQEFVRNTDVLNVFVSTAELFKAVDDKSNVNATNAIKKGAVIDAKNIKSKAPLHLAAWSGSLQLVNILLEKGANSSIVGSNGLTPVHYATKSPFSRLDIVIALLSHGAVYNATSDKRKTPLRLSKNDNITQFLSLVQKYFESVENKNGWIINDLNQITDTSKLKAILFARSEGCKLTLIETAVLSNFPKIKELMRLGQETTLTEYESALSLAQRGDFEEALTIIERALDERVEILGIDNPGTWDIKFDKAKVLCEQGKYKDSLKILFDICKRQKLVFGENHKESLKTRGYIALVLSRQGNHAGAFCTLEDVYQQQTSDPNNADALETLFHKAEVLERLGKLEEALDANNTVLNAWENNDLRNIPVLKNRASILTHQGKYGEALGIYNDVLRREVSFFGLKNTNTINTSRSIAQILYRQKDYAAALKKYQEILDTQKSFLDYNHSNILMTCYDIASVKVMQGKYKDALTEYKKIFEPLKAAVGRDHLIALGHSEKISVIDFMCNQRSSLALEYIDFEYLRKYDLFLPFFKYT